MNAEFLVRVAVDLARIWFYDGTIPSVEPPQAVAQAAAAPSQTAFQESRSISVAPEHGSVLGFVADGTDALLVISGGSVRYGAFTGSRPAGPIANRVVWMTAAGEERQATELPMIPRGVNHAGDGMVYVVGETSVAWYDRDGKLVGQREAPHFILPEQDHEAFTEEAVERRDLSISAYERQLKQYEDTLKAIEDKPEDERTPYENESQITILTRQVESRKSAIESRQAMTPKQLFDEAVGAAKQLYRVAVSKDHVFLVGRETFGYGYAVWRCDRDCENPEKIISGLSGCCGQMDLQVIEEQLVVAENSRHRVVVADFAGETVTTFGSRERTGTGDGFSGCCNPMNTCSTPDGGLLTSESNGCIKRFAADGTFQEVVGTAAVQSGCKNSTVGMAADGSRVYYLDVRKGTILVLEKPDVALAQKG